MPSAWESALVAITRRSPMYLCIRGDHVQKGEKATNVYREEPSSHVLATRVGCELKLAEPNEIVIHCLYFCMCVRNVSL